MACAFKTLLAHVLCPLLGMRSPLPLTWRTAPHPRPSSIVSISVKPALHPPGRTSPSSLCLPGALLLCLWLSPPTDCELHEGRDQAFFIIVFVYIVQSLAHGRYLINVYFMFIWLNIYLIPEVYSGDKCLLNKLIYHTLFWKHLSLSMFSEAFYLNFWG